MADVELNFNNYVNSYSENVREIIENFQIEKIVTKLVKNDLLFMLVDKFTEVDLNRPHERNATQSNGEVMQRITLCFMLYVIK